MIRRSIFFVALIFLLVVCAACGGCVFLSPEIKQTDVPPELNVSLSDFRISVDARAAEMEGALLTTAGSLSTIACGDPDLNDVLRDLYTKFPASIGVCYVDKDIGAGRSVPLGSLYSLIKDSHLRNISADSFSEKNMLMLGPIYTPEYGEIIAFVAPVYSPEGNYRGYICNALDPSGIVNEDLCPGTRYYSDSGYLFWIVRNDGTIIYAPDNDFIGQKLSDDSFYPELSLKGAGDHILSAPEGAMQYHSATGRERIMVWTTTFVGDKEIRLLLAIPEGYDTAPLLPRNPNIDEIHDAAVSLFQYASGHGQKQTIAELQKSNGTFYGKDVSYFAYTMDGIIIYDSDEQDTAAGRNVLNTRDAYGLRPVATQILRCMQGGGYVSAYRLIHLPEVDQTVLYLSYVIPVNEEWYVGARMPVMSSLVPVNSEKREEILQMTHNLTSYTLIHGKDAALAEINLPEGRFFTENISVSALGYDGIILADSVHPEMTGEDAFYYTDASGSSSMREVVMQAKLGGGYMYFGIHDAEKEEILLCLIFIEPMEDDWCICSAIALDRIPIYNSSNIF